MARLRGWEKEAPPLGGLPTWAPMKTLPAELRTARQWEREGRRVLSDQVAKPVGFAWRQPGVYHGHHYGGWLPVYRQAQTVQKEARGDLCEGRC